MHEKQLKLIRKKMNRPRHRNFTIEVRAGHDKDDDKKGRISFAASSNNPMETFVMTDDFMGRAFEVLSHKKADVDLTRFDAGAGHFILDHNPTGLNSNLGVIDKASVDGKRLNVDIKFNPHNPDAAQVEDEMKDGFRPNVSIGFVRDSKSAKMVGEKDGLPIFEFGFAPHEVSSVLIPADATVGAGRSEEELLYRELGLDKNDAEHRDLASALLKEMKTVQVDAPMIDLSKPEVAEAFADAIKEVTDKENDDKSEDALLIIDTDKTNSARNSTGADSNESPEEKVMSEIKDNESTPEVTAGADKDVARRDVEAAVQLCRDEGNLDLAATAALDGWSLDYTRARLFEAQKTARQVETMTPMEASTKEQRELNLPSAMRKFIVDHDSSPVNDLGREIAHACGMVTSPNAFYIPINRALELRAGLQTSPAAQGGNLVATTFRPLADTIFEASIARALGVRFEQVDTTQQIPRWLTNNVATWVSEDSAISLSSGSLAIVTATPNQLVAHVPITPFLGVAQAGGYDPISSVLDNMVDSLGEQVETAIFQGGGTAEPTGLLNDTGITNIANTTASLDVYTSLWEAVRTTGSMAAGPFVVSIDVYRRGLTVIPFTGTTEPTIKATPTAQFSGLTAVGAVQESGHMPAQSALYGSFDTVLAANFGVIEVKRDESMQAANGLDVLRARLFFDLVAQNPGKLAMDSGSVSITG
ncbi:hypothetical protein LCGC14_1033020 [marine sediment metagenome]|uniref:Phage capsid-like C-terminal domain-containing protein n=1 Tax=marine sediment metagenome TaxID=412755 RepID=A0A0F9MYQ3_9ZZZZ